MKICPMAQKIPKVGKNDCDPSCWEYLASYST